MTPAVCNFLYSFTIFLYFLTQVLTPSFYLFLNADPSSLHLFLSIPFTYWSFLFSFLLLSSVSRVFIIYLLVSRFFPIYLFVRFRYLPPFIPVSLPLVVYLFICGLHYAASTSNRIESKGRMMIRMISSELFGNGEYWNIREQLWALYAFTWRDWWKPRKIRVRKSAFNPRPSEARVLPFVISLFLQKMAVFHFLFICLRRLFPFVVSVPSPPSLLCRTTVFKEQYLSLIHSAVYVTTA